MFYLGCHLSVSDGFAAMGQTALGIGANTFQFFTRNPRGMSRREPGEEDLDRLNGLMAENGFGPIIAHAPYIYNPASPEKEKWDLACRAMKEDVLLLEKIPGALYNFHPGSHVGTGSGEGIARCAALLCEVLPLCRQTTVLIETMAGKGSEIGKTFEEVAGIVARVDPSLRNHLGVCLDTCHVHDGGYDIAGDPDGVLSEFDSVVGLSRLKAIHLNDSKNPLGSAKDRHERIGQGDLTLEGIERIIRHPKLKDLPFVLETPCDLEGYREEIRLLRSLRAD
ncbi:MAG: deoxyribonuclease IV [Clostridia bacterium]|nr:deoxyribonuclease IV [Clostridia bacterium]